MNSILIPSLIGGILSIVLSFFILAKNKDKEGKLLSLFCLSISLYGIFGFLTGISTIAEKALFYDKISIIGIIASMPLFIHFSHLLLKKKNQLHWLPYIISGLFIVLTHLNYIFEAVENSAGYYVGVIGDAFSYLLIYLIISFVYVVGLYIRSFTLSKSKIARNRIKYLLTALSILVLAGILDFLRKLEIFAFTQHLITDYAIMIFVVIVTYVICKYHLLNINIVFHKSAMLSIIGALVLLCFELLKIFFEKLFEHIFHISQPEVSAVSVLALTFFFEPIKNRTEKFCDRVFLGK